MTVASFDARTALPGPCGPHAAPRREVVSPIPEVRYPLVRNHPCRVDGADPVRSCPCRGCSERELCREAERCWRSPLPTRSVACLVVPGGDVHPSLRVDGLAQDDDVDGCPVGGSRWDADRRRDVGRGVASRLPVDARLPVRPGVGDTARAVDRGVVDLAVERQPLRREPVAQHLEEVRGAVSAGLLTPHDLQDSYVRDASELGYLAQREPRCVGVADRGEPVGVSLVAALRGSFDSCRVIHLEAVRTREVFAGLHSGFADAFVCDADFVLEPCCVEVVEGSVFDSHPCFNVAGIVVGQFGDALLVAAICGCHGGKNTYRGAACQA